MKIIRVYLCCLVIISMFGCASTRQINKSLDDEALVDPIEPINRKVFNFNEFLDDSVLEPVSQGYSKVLPNTMRTGIRNFFDNIEYLNVLVNNFLQGNIDKGLSDVSRVIFNSTIGIGGFFDVASGLNIPKHNEDFGQTLAALGVKQGAYLYLPLLGPTNTKRGLPNLATKILLDPLTYISFSVSAPLALLDIINIRSNLQYLIEMRDVTAVDPYIFTREIYIQHRQMIVNDGQTSQTDEDDFFDFEEQ